MPASSHIPQAGSDCLTADHLRELLATCGYQGAIVAGAKSALPAGCGVVLQFGDELAASNGQAMQPVIRCNLAFNGSNPTPGGVTRWQLHKTVQMSTEKDRFSFAVEADVMFGECVRLGEALAHGGDIFRHLRLLLADARYAVQTSPLAREGDPTVEKPVLRIEARFVGDLAAGRSGFLRRHTAPSRAGVPQLTAFDRCLAEAACDCLADQVIPELARAFRGLIARCSTDTTLVQSSARDRFPESTLCPIP
jgi:hypothetical protein